MKLLPIFPFTWQSQVKQYPPAGEPGMGYFAGSLSDPDLPPVDCLLWRSDDGALRGILNHFPVDYPPWEQAGNITLIVDPTRRRQGIAHRLLAEADRRWDVPWTQQGYTKDGLLTVVRFLSLAERRDELNAVLAELIALQQ